MIPRSPVIASDVLCPLDVSAAVAASSVSIDTPAVFAIGATLPMLPASSPTVVLPAFTATKKASDTSVAEPADSP